MNNNESLVGELNIQVCSSSFSVYQTISSLKEFSVILKATTILFITRAEKKDRQSCIYRFVTQS